MNHIRHDADLLTVLHDIDAARGKFCSSCKFFAHRVKSGFCLRGYKPAAGMDGTKDGCDDWKARELSVLGDRKRFAKRKAA